jgi:hypothetical protein
MLQGLERLRKNSSFDRMGRGIPQRLKPTLVIERFWHE